ncbi:MAG: TIGR02391 family protein, partial [Acidimicrobiales bacterium]|nr:TIGR02391 family protein [Acidimicrobiales bacterium]
AGRVQRKLVDLDCHSEAIRYCEIELLRRSNFHAASEAVKGVFERIREMSGSGLDGAVLVDDVLSFRSHVPVLAMSMLRTDTERSEQTGLMNLLKGLYGLYRNPLAHEPRLVREDKRAISETELVSVLVTVSLAHHHLDRCWQTSVSDN